MAGLIELEQWDEELYQLETTDPVVGGLNGISNKQAKTLGNRTRYLKALILNSIVSATDTGIANAYVCSLTSVITERAEGLVIKFKVVNSNTGASTINDGISIAPLVGSAHSALQGGELVAGGDAWVQWNSTVGTGSYVLLFCSNAPRQISNGKKTQHAVAVNQLFGDLKGIKKFEASGEFVVPESVTEIYISASAGGGGGGGGYTTTFAGQGGGAGACILREKFTVTPGDAIAITIGAGGTAGGVATAGGNGGTTIIGSLISLSGGFRGNAGTYDSGGGTYGGPGNVYAGAGRDGLGSVPGDGGDNLIGFGGSRRSASGTSGVHGGGGAGGVANANGGSGGVGIVIIEW